jgi:ATP-grasp domain-containing protein
MLLLVPADVLRPRQPDDHFAAEARAAADAGITVALVDHDALARPGGAAAAVRTVPAGDDAVYRGWMLSADRYADFTAALTARGVTPRTSATRYRQAHELPGWYAALAAVTPESVWSTGTGRAEFDDLCARLGAGPAVLRDYTKSMKHHWHDAAYVPDVADRAAAWAIAARFAELREDVDGGFVLRRFERFGSAEVRTWWVDGTCRLVGPHPDTPDDLPDGVDLDAVAPLVAALDLRFVTVDLARRDDGTWRVIELGDGQVSDRPASIGPEKVIEAIVGGG